MKMNKEQLNTIDDSDSAIDISRNTVIKVFELDLPTSNNDETLGNSDDVIDYAQDLENEEQIRDKISEWSSDILTKMFLVLKKMQKISISKDDCHLLGSSWSKVVGKWYPQRWLEATEQTGDKVNAFEPELNAFRATWTVFKSSNSDVKISDKKSSTDPKEIQTTTDKKMPSLKSLNKHFPTTGIIK